MSEIDLKKAIDEKLEIVIRLLALLVLEGKSKKQSVNLLGNAGLDRNVIAALVGTTPLTVSVIRSEAKKTSRAKQRTQTSEGL